MHVVLHCALTETAYNPYYSHLLVKLCTYAFRLMSRVVACSACLLLRSFRPHSFHFLFLHPRTRSYARSYRVTLQFALWDRFKELDSLSLRSLSNLAHVMAACVGAGALPLSVLKSLPFQLLQPRQVSPREANACERCRRAARTFFLFFSIFFLLSVLFCARSLARSPHAFSKSRQVVLLRIFFIALLGSSTSEDNVHKLFHAAGEREDLGALREGVCHFLRHAFDTRKLVDEGERELVRSRAKMARMLLRDPTI